MELLAAEFACTPECSFRLYESASAATFPEGPVWEFTTEATYQGQIADLDADGTAEIVILTRPASNQNRRISAFEARSDNAFVQTVEAEVPDLGAPQEMMRAADLDGDGKIEVLVGGIAKPPTSPQCSGCTCSRPPAMTPTHGRGGLT